MSLTENPFDAGFEGETEDREIGVDVVETTNEAVDVDKEASFRAEGDKRIRREEDDTRTGLQEELLRPEVDEGEAVTGEGDEEEDGDEAGEDIATEGITVNSSRNTVHV